MQKINKKESEWIKWKEILFKKFKVIKIIEKLKDNNRYIVLNNDK